MNGALNIPSRQKLQCITCIDRQGCIDRLHPLPFLRRVITNLESSNRLTEKERETAQIGMSTNPVVELLRLLGGIFAVLHVAEMVLTLHLVLMDIGEVVFGKFQRNGEENKEGVQDLGVKSLSE